MGQGATGLAGVLSLAGALPAGTPLLLDVGHTLPPGGDVLTPGRGLDVSLGDLGGTPGGIWALPGWWGPVPSLLPYPRHRSRDLTRISSAAGFLLRKPRCLPGRRLPMAWGGCGLCGDKDGVGTRTSTSAGPGTATHV